MSKAKEIPTELDELTKARLAHSEASERQQAAHAQLRHLEQVLQKANEEMAVAYNNLQQAKNDSGSL